MPGQSSEYKAGQGWSHAALQSSALLQEGCRRMPPVSGSVWVPGCCRSCCSQVFSPLLVPSLDGAPSGLTLLWLLSLLETLWMIFAAYCHDWQSVSMLLNSQLGRCTSGLSALVTAWKSFSSVPLPFFLLGKKKKRFPALQRLVKNQSLQLSCALI